MDCTLISLSRLKSTPDTESFLGKGVLHRAPRNARAVEGSLSLSFGLASVRDEIEEDYDNHQNETC